MTRRLLFIAALFLSLSVALTALAQETKPEAKTFDQIDACSALTTELNAVQESSKQLEEAFPADIADRDAMLVGIFQGTQLLLEYGEALFAASDKHEEKCKAALRDQGLDADIVKIYDLLLEPTARGYDFLVRVRDTAKRLDDTPTVNEMEGAIKDYKAAALQLADFCETDLPEESREARCGELRKRLDARFR